MLEADIKSAAHGNRTVGKGAVEEHELVEENSPRCLYICGICVGNKNKVIISTMGRDDQLIYGSAYPPPPSSDYKNYALTLCMAEVRIKKCAVMGILCACSQ